ncbi:hypothetical protein vseg_004152 [Gypsophila vaccaria]
MKIWVFAFCVLFLQLASESSTLGLQENVNIKKATTVVVVEDVDTMQASIVAKRGMGGGGRGGGGGHSGGHAGEGGGGHSGKGQGRGRARGGGLLPVVGGAGAAAGMVHSNHNHHNKSATSRDAYVGLTLPLVSVTIAVSLFNI